MRIQLQRIGADAAEPCPSQVYHRWETLETLEASYTIIKVVDTSVEVLGLQIEDGPGRSLRVIGISHESAMDIFNQMNPRDKVSPGDLIIRVNGTAESLEALWDAICASLEEFVLVLLNGPEAQSYGEDDLPDGLV